MFCIVLLDLLLVDLQWSSFLIMAASSERKSDTSLLPFKLQIKLGQPAEVLRRFGRTAKEGRWKRQQFGGCVLPLGPPLLSFLGPIVLCSSKPGTHRHRKKIHVLSVRICVFPAYRLQPLVCLDKAQEVQQLRQQLASEEAEVHKLQLSSNEVASSVALLSIANFKQSISAPQVLTCSTNVCVVFESSMYLWIL